MKSKLQLLLELENNLLFISFMMRHSLSYACALLLNMLKSCGNQEEFK